LPVTDMSVIGSSPQAIRTLTSSLDRSIVLFDVHAGRQIFRLGLPEPIESVAINGTEDIVFAGSSSGNIYCIDMIAAYHSLVATAAAPSSSSNNKQLPEGVSLLVGHTKAITALDTSSVSNIFVSSSADGSIRWWDSENMQCIRESKPFQKTALTNAMVCIPTIVLVRGIAYYSTPVFIS
jgi:WD40 repeat protein